MNPTRPADYARQTWRDVVYAVRHLVRAPTFSIVAIATLALGTGATTAIFSVVRAVVLRPFPIQGADRVVRMFETNPTNNAWATSEPNYLDYRDGARSFSAFAALAGRGASLLDHGDPIQLNGAAVTANYFDVVAARPILGVPYNADNDRFGGNTHVVVLSEGIWNRIFASDPAIVGKVVNIDGASYRIVAVMPNEDSFLPSDFWVPLAPDPNGVRGSHQLIGLARLKHGISIAQADADLSAIATRLARLYPNSNRDWGARVVALDQWLLGQTIRRQMLVLFGAVILVLLLACANIGNLLLVRATARQREITVRRALGASRPRVLRQLLTESAVLSSAGSIAGLACAAALMPLLRHASPGNIPRLNEATIDVPVLLFALGVSCLAALIFGVLPAVHAARVDLQWGLRQGARSVSGGDRGRRSRLIVAEVALAASLLVGAALLGRSVINLAGVSTGFTADAVLQFAVATPNELPRERRALFFQGIETAIAAVPGVVRVGATSIVPFTGGNTNTRFLIEGRDDKPGDFVAANWRSVTPGLFTALEIPLKRGRMLDATDLADHPRVALIDETMARHLWPNDDAIGKRIMAANSPRAAADQITIVGIVGVVRDQSPATDPASTVYLPMPQRPWVSMTFLAKVRGPSRPVVEGIERALRQSAPETPLPTIVPLSSSLDVVLAPQRFTAGLLLAFSSIAVLLAAIGIYGVISYSVAMRAQEMGIRLALGATPGRVAALILYDGCVPTLVGIGMGSAAAVALSRVMTSLLFGTSSTDVATYAAVATLLLAVSLLSSAIPAHRAATVDPVVALRAD